MYSNFKPRVLGVTPPISESLPAPHELEATESLIAELKAQGQYESPEEALKREHVLGQLDTLFKRFVTETCLKNGLAESLVAEVGGKIFTFGSYRLGVHGKSSDIDTLCVAPKYVKRDDFMDSMHSMLKENPQVTEITIVPEAYVPVIKMCFSGIPIDLIFARLNMTEVREDLDLSNHGLLKNIDERCVRSLNGSRVTDDILKLVPDIEAFRTALRCIKLWAKRKAIYSNVMGFFGGVAWAIAVARVCQLYPFATSSTIVSKFFRIMHQWMWPQPVLLKPIEEGPLQVRVWNPKLYPQDRSHRMPVITPAYPSMCSTHNVTLSTQTVTQIEFQRAAEIADKVMLGLSSWSSLFLKHDFFHRYKYYLQIVASSTTEEASLRWSGWVESRLRQLVMKLELVETIEIAHPFIQSFTKIVHCRNDEEKREATQGKFEGTEIVEGETFPIYLAIFYVGLSVKSKEDGPRKLDISLPISEFQRMVKVWDNFDDPTMGITMRYIRASELPLEVYDDKLELEKVLKKRTKSKTRTSVNGEAPAKKIRSVDSPFVPVEETVEEIVNELEEDKAMLYSQVVTATGLTTNGGMTTAAPAVSPIVPTKSFVRQPAYTPVQMIGSGMTLKLKTAPPS